VQQGAYARDAEDVVLWVQRTYGATRLYALGICANCSSVLLAAAALPAVISGLILVTPAVLDVNLHRQSDAAPTFGAPILGRCLEVGAWRTLLTRLSDFRGARDVARGLLRKSIADGRRALARISRTARPSHPDFNSRFWEGFRAVMKHGTPVLTLLAEMDQVAREFEDEFRRPVLDRDERYGKLCEVRLLPGADHSLVFDEGRQGTLAAIVGWFEALEGRDRAACQPDVRASTQRTIPAESTAVSTSA
jgi:alpha-beta hydrolase superfamily lysophospholipase